MNNTLQGFIMASRPKTLPLAASVVLFSGVCAQYYGVFHPTLFVLLLGTTLCLQVVSNFANDYGDYKKGTDRLAHRSDRALAAGILTPKHIAAATVFTSVLSLVLGLTLLYFSFGSLGSTSFILMLLLGLLAIGAAITYTVGKLAYGYRALGDLFVFIFFGPVAIWGALFLYHTHAGSSLIVQDPSFAIAATLCSGLIPVCVLTLNNMRDIQKDKESDKITIPVLLGFDASQHYFSALMGIALISYILMAWKLLEPGNIVLPALAILSVVVGLKRIHKIRSFSIATQAEPFHAELRNTSLVALLFALSLWT